MRVIARTIVVMSHCLFLTSSGFADERNRLSDKIDFNRDVRPILSKACFSCHGFDEKARKAGLRLDSVEGATGTADSGRRAVVPGQSELSEVIRRVTSIDAGERMPPSDSGKTLTDDQIQVLRRWIQQGAPYKKHWAFEKPLADSPLTPKREEWSRNRIDDFVLSRLEQEQLSPTVAADAVRLFRRVSLDLIGLPPTLEELDIYLEQARHDPEAAYTSAVDRLLASPHFGERMAIDWMDAARYADTNGYFGDKPRQAWPWRDWVIAAFNANMPFDQFTIEQLAGDLLPNATRDQRIATGFHRNAMANNETGIIDEEYRVEAVADRVDTTATVWLGMTIGCAQCHDHKFDPVSQREYYQLFAYFNNSVEPGLILSDSPPPTIEVLTPELEAERDRRQRKLVESEQTFAKLSQSLDHEIMTWRQTALAQLPETASDGILTVDFDSPSETEKSVGTTIKKERGIRGDAGRFDATQHIEVPTEFDVDRPWMISVWFKPETSLGCLFSKIEPIDRRRGLEILWQKGKLYINLVHQWGVDEITTMTTERLPQSQWSHVLLQYDGSRKAVGLRLTMNGEHAGLTVRSDSLTGSVQCAEPLRIARRDAGLGFYGLLDQFTVFPRLLNDGEATTWFHKEKLRGIFERLADQQSTADSTFLKEYYIEKLAMPEVRAAFHSQEESRRSVTDMRRLIPTTLVMEDRKELRKTFVLSRGQYDQPSEEVTATVPAMFPSVPMGAPPNRLTFARWLVSPDNPLTARVIVNRMWQICFGEGLVRTPNDFGSQGEPPTHPELLDDLAVQFVDSGWDVKRLLRLIVTSSTYRQSSQATEELLRRDPENRLIARGPRFRLPAELLRDQALAASGLLSSKLGGQSVRPYQPDGLWEAVSYNGDETYVQDTDDGLWRRSLYTYWKRQAPPPVQLTFDAGTREKCSVRRSRTNTPLQALIMLNDPTWIEAARVLADKNLAIGGNDSHRIRDMFRRVVSREPESDELNLLIGLLDRQRTHYRADPESAKRILAVGAAPPAHQANASELAAWTIVAQTILNLDEVVTRR